MSTAHVGVLTKTLVALAVVLAAAPLALADTTIASLPAGSPNTALDLAVLGLSGACVTNPSAMLIGNEDAMCGSLASLTSAGSTTDSISIASGEGYGNAVSELSAAIDAGRIIGGYAMDLADLRNSLPRVSLITSEPSASGASPSTPASNAGLTATSLMDDTTSTLTLSESLSRGLLIDIS